MKTLEVTALLPMKDHSERVPNKNVRDLSGKPLYHWVLRSLLDSKYVKQVIINTDSDRIAEDALRHFGRVRIINRQQSIRGDFVSMNNIIAYDLSQTEGEYFLQTHSTNPLLTTSSIDRAIETYFKGLNAQYDSLFSVTRYQVRLYWQDGRAINHNPDELIRTQDLEPIYEENSNIYIFSKTSFTRNNNNRIGLYPQLFELSKLEAIDIDEEDDFRLAEMILRQTIAT